MSVNFVPPASDDNSDHDNSDDDCICLGRWDTFRQSLAMSKRKKFRWKRKKFQRHRKTIHRHREKFRRHRHKFSRQRNMSSNMSIFSSCSICARK